MTLKKIAEKANVSVSTASRALNNAYGISESTRNRVIEVAEKCGYLTEKKRIKIENRRKDSPTFAIICPEIISSYYSRMAMFLIDFLRQNNCNCTIYNTAFSEENLRLLFKKCVNNPDTDAIISFCDFKEFSGSVNIPVTVLGNSECFSSVETEIFEGIKAATEHLLSKGKKHIAFVGEQLTLSKQKDFLNICTALPDVQNECFCSDKRFEEAGVSAAHWFLNRSMLPDAIICAYDEIAYGLIDTLGKNGVRIPQDISVIGINDIPSAPYFFGGLSTVAFDHGKPLKTAVTDMINDHKNGTVSQHKYTAEAKLILRNTD